MTEWKIYWVRVNDDKTVEKGDIGILAADKQDAIDRADTIGKLFYTSRWSIEKIVEVKKENA